jgi:hypothetical protein
VMTRRKLIIPLQLPPAIVQHGWQDHGDVPMTQQLHRTVPGRTTSSGQW